jgi:hypothetical protein
MRNKYFALAAISALLLNVAAFAGGDTNRTKAAKKRASMRLVSMLPASDGVAIFDARQFVGSSLPTILASNQPALAEITARINEMANRTGVDLRKFDEVAVGIATKQVSPTETDYEPVAIASGDVADGALNAIKKLAANGSYREEKVAGKTVYIFTAGPSMQNTSSAGSGSKITAALHKALRGLQHEIAVTALNSNTLVVGTPTRVRETLEARSHVGADVVALLAAKEMAVVNFAFKSSGHLGKLLPLEADMMGKSLDNIQYISGSLEVASTGTTLQATARMRLPHDAAQLKDTLDVLKSMGGALLGNSNKPNQALYGRMINNLRVTLRGTDVTIDLSVPQSDIDSLVGAIK